VVRVVAADVDEGLNGQLHYVLAASVPDAAFDVDRVDGSVRALTSVNRERYSSFSFAVYAVDHGSPALTGTALVVVVIADVNDQVPVFARESYKFDVDENAPEGSDVGSVFAVDGDVVSANGDIRYSIVDSGTDDLVPFSVETRTGNIRTTTPLNREKRAEYRLKIAATDNGKPALTATVDVVVRVNDENDNSPVLEFTSPSSPSSTSAAAGLLDVDTIVISSAVPRGFVVCRAVARDADSGVNAHINFRLVSADSDVNNATSSRHLFAVNWDTGEVVVASQFGGVGEGEAREYRLTVRASDGGVPVRSADAVLRVVVNGSLPYPHGSGAPLTGSSFVTGSHVTLLLIIAGCSALLTVALVVAIAVLRTRGRKSRARRLRQYDVQKSLTTDDVQLKSTVTSFETVPLSSTYCSNDALHIVSLPSPQSTPCGHMTNGTAVHFTDSNFPNSTSTVTFTNNKCTKHQFIHLLTATFKDLHIENSKNYKR